ncbi:peptide/nickel transport system ATP-binding protein [Prauserella flava]|nr:peptide/nickel transport system ATP-binding protein [Prauserella flava]MCR3733944.1 peptide/nickel transport system ATP-binding protein [Prauserella salsuginis]
MTSTPDSAAPDAAPGSGPIVSVRDLERTYRGGVHALRGVSLDVPRGGRFGIVGESGSGKSTLVRLLAALDRPTAGTVTFEGQRIDDRRESDLGFLRRRLQIVFQDPMGSLDPRMRVRDIISEPLGRTRDRDERVAELLDAVGLPSDAGAQYPHRFSGGQRQRISIARALAPRPDVLIADEAVSALDVLVRKQILDLLTRLVDEYALTLVFVSHDLGVVRKMCDEVAVMRRGEVVEHGPVDEVYDAPRHDYTRELIAAAPTLHGALRAPAGSATSEASAAGPESSEPEPPPEG